MSRPRSLLQDLDTDVRKQLRAAQMYAGEHLSDIRRRSGETYAEHGWEVAQALLEMTGDAALLSAAALHDLLVHPKGDRLLSRSPLSRDARELVKKMHPLRRLHIDANTEDLDRVVSAITEDMRLLPLRMAHRLNDVRHLNRFAPALSRQIANESLHMYTAIAGRLGMHAWRSEMEEICFPQLYGKAANKLQDRFLACRSLDDACLKHAKRFVSTALRKKDIAFSIEGRIKGLYSTYRKMIIKARPFEDMTDRLALRIVVENTEDCYRVLGIVHERLHPIPGKLKDYIGAPKENGYRSIHTVVYPLPGVTEQPIEVQIRTRDMHRECEYGIAAHGEYKSAAYALRAASARVNLFRNLESLREEARSPEQFEKVLRTYFRDDHVAIFDHRNNLYHLHRPATALDFVCHAFPRRLGRLKAVRINGREQHPGTALRDGDIVEAMFGKTTLVEEEWIRAIEHRASKNLIRRSLRKSEVIEASSQ